MKVINNENVVLFDCDQTLAIWHKDHKKPGKGKLLFVDPYTGDKLYLYPHSVHIRLLRQYKGRGFAVIVHSMAGVKWAETIVRVLKLEKYVDLCMSKATKHVDDKEDVKDIIGTRVYLHNNLE